jgi:hypothetical protein
MGWPAGCDGFLGDQYGTEHDFMYQGSLERDTPDYYDDDPVARITSMPAPVSYQFQFKDLADLCASQVFKHQLAMVLESKERTINRQREEMLRLYMQIEHLKEKIDNKG